MKQFNDDDFIYYLFGAIVALVASGVIAVLLFAIDVLFSG